MQYNWDENPDLNITPLVDIMLVLLAILMVTAPVIVYEEDIVLPQGSKTKQVQEDAKLDIRMDRQRKVYVLDNVYDYAEFPDNFVQFSQPYDRKTKIYIRADKNLKYENVVYLLKSVKEAGFLRVSLVTDG